MRGRFITFEGIEGSGKSTQIRLFAEYLRGGGLDVVETREPGGTDVGDQIRKILLNPKNIDIAPLTELLLYVAARAQHVSEKIRPALGEGKVVISDRYADATTAYQGAARMIPETVLKKLHEVATGRLEPDLTLLLDLPAEIGLRRALKRNREEGKQDRFENERTEFHKKVRSGYLDIAKSEPGRVVVIDASGNVDEVFKNIVAAYEKRYNRT